MHHASLLRLQAVELQARARHIRAVMGLPRRWTAAGTVALSE